MQIHGLEGMSVQQAYWNIDTHDDVIAARPLEHISHQFRCDRGATLVLLVLSGVREEGEDGGDALRAGNLAGMDHDTHFHERGVDGAAASIDDVHVVLAHRLDDPHMALANPAFRYLGAAERYSQPEEKRRRGWMGILLGCWSFGMRVGRGSIWICSGRGISTHCLNMSLSRSGIATVSHTLFTQYAVHCANMMDRQAILGIQWRSNALPQTLALPLRSPQPDAHIRRPKNSLDRLGICPLPPSLAALGRSWNPALQDPTALLYRWARV